jgi:hypothetical protein
MLLSGAAGLSPRHINVLLLPRLENTPSHLIQLNRFKQRLEVAFAESFISLA